MTGIWPMVHDINDPLFKHVMKMTETAIVNRMIHQKKLLILPQMIMSVNGAFSILIMVNVNLQIW